MKKILLSLLLTSASLFANVEMCVLDTNSDLANANNSIPYITVMCIDRKMVLINPDNSSTQLLEGTGRSLRETYCHCSKNEQE